MKWIKTKDITDWAEKRDCEENLPLLLRKLIRSSTQNIKNIEFPSGENVLLGGWDGVLESKEETPCFPNGHSVWEFGRNKGIKAKADGDYNKRTKNPLGVDPSKTTFIFVTPRRWSAADKWVKSKKKENVWKDVKVITAENLEEWIDSCPTVGAWLAKEHLKIFTDNVESAQSRWKLWATKDSIQLSPQLLHPGRKNELESFKKSIDSNSITGVQGSSKEEALAFILSYFKNELDIEEDFFSRSIVIEDETSFKKLSNHPSPLILITTIDDNGLFNNAQANGHLVLVPLSPDYSGHWKDRIRLPRIDRDGFINALVESGISQKKARDLSRESGRNIAVLRRLMKFNRSVPKWSTEGDIENLIPAILVGKWNEASEGDKKIMSQIAGEDYEAFSSKLHKFLKKEDSPLIKIGSHWRMVSPLDSWICSVESISSVYFNRFREAVIQVITEINPKFDLEPENRFMAGVHGKTHHYSSSIREGLTHSLTLISVYGEVINITLETSPSQWVESLISSVLNSDDELLWKSINYLLPTLAEASPTGFLSTVEKHLSKEKSPVNMLFDEDPGFMTADTYHTGLLWALEELAWIPEFFERSTILLTRLANVDPGGSTANRPFNSLVNIFKPWHYQTMATRTERLECLKKMAEIYPNETWSLLIKLLPNGAREIGMYTQQPRWRLFEQDEKRELTQKELINTYNNVIDLLLGFNNLNEEKLSQLLEVSVDLPEEQKVKIFDLVKSNHDKISNEENLIWNVARGILSHHKATPGAYWSMNDEQLTPYKELYNNLQPKNLVSKISWLFNDHWPELPEGFINKEMDWRERQKEMDNRRAQALKDFFQETSLEQIIELSNQVKEKFILGQTLVRIELDFETDIQIIKNFKPLLKDSMFEYGFVFQKAFSNGIEWYSSILKRLLETGVDKNIIVKFLLSVRPSNDLWDLVERQPQNIVDSYWLEVQSNPIGLDEELTARGVKKLMESKRYFEAIKASSYHTDLIQPETLLNLLEIAATENSTGDYQLQDYEIGVIFENLDKRIGEEDMKRMSTLEWYYFELLERTGSRRKIKYLYQELAFLPDLFITFLKFIYKENDEKTGDKKDMSQEQIQKLAWRSHQLLESLNIIPGIDESGRIELEVLQSWITDVRRKAKEIGRLNGADYKIGTLLSKYPEGEDSWPPDEICEIIQEVNSSHLNSTFSTSTMNKRSFTSRGAFEGGKIERSNAEYFQKLADLKRLKYPIVATILEEISKRYMKDSERMDNEAEIDKLNI